MLFDAGFTLVEPARSVPELYLEEARRVGARPDPGAFQARLAACWREQAVLRSGQELATSEEEEAAGWRRFTAAVAAPFPELAARHEAWLQALVARFDDPAAWRPCPEARETLEHLARMGLILGVVSNWHGALHRILEGLGLLGHLGFVVVSSEAGWRKPHPGIFEEALRRAGVPAAVALHVGDSLEDDVRGARAAGLQAALLAGPGQTAPAGVHILPGLAALAGLLCPDV